MEEVDDFIDCVMPYTPSDLQRESEESRHLKLLGADAQIEREIVERRGKRPCEIEVLAP
jgi:hypothetical protein